MGIFNTAAKSGGTFQAQTFPSIKAFRVERHDISKYKTDFTSQMFIISFRLARHTSYIIELVTGGSCPLSISSYPTGPSIGGSGSLSIVTGGMEFAFP